MIKICEHCGIEFDTDRDNKRFCTRKCKEASKNKRISKGIRHDNIKYNKKCPACGKKFVTIYYDKVYCSKKCSNIYSYKKNKEHIKQWRKDNPNYYKEYYKNSKKYYVCLTCGTLFQHSNHNLINPYCEDCVNKKDFKHVCVQCGLDFISDKRNECICNECKLKNKQKRKENKKKLYTKVCIICGEEFITSHKNTIMCSDKCRKIRDYQKSKEYRENPLTRHKYKEAQRKSKRKRLKNDLDFKLKHIIHVGILQSLKKHGKCGKDLHTLEYVDYTIQELERHLESQFKPDMNWANHGTLWDIDHIKPKAMFKFVVDGVENIKAIKECWALNNLRPLYKKDNIKKSSLYDGNLYRNGVIFRSKQIE